MTKEQPDKRPRVPSAAEWGARVAEQSTPWSDSAWHRACATWGIKIDCSEEERDD